jgi:hypothetical protein
LNPKWVLCDSNRWYELYRKLLLSDDPDIQQSMNIWFPPESGLREQIERIHNFRPEGFYAEPPAEDVEDGLSAYGGSTGHLSTGNLSSPSLKGKLRKSAQKGDQDHLLSMFAMNLMEKEQAAAGMDGSSNTAVDLPSKKGRGKILGRVKKKLWGKSPGKDTDESVVSQSEFGDDKSRASKTTIGGSSEKKLFRPGSSERKMRDVSLSSNTGGGSDPTREPRRSGAGGLEIGRGALARTDGFELKGEHISDADTGTDLSSAKKRLDFDSPGKKASKSRTRRRKKKKGKEVEWTRTSLLVAESQGKGS